MTDMDEYLWDDDNGRKHAPIDPQSLVFRPVLSNDEIDPDVSFAASKPLELGITIGSDAFVVLDSEAQHIFGDEPTIRVVASNADNALFARGGGVWVPRLRSVFFTSANDGPEGASQLFRLYVPSRDAPVHHYKIEPLDTNLPNPSGLGPASAAAIGRNGARGREGLLACVRGTRTTHGGLCLVDVEPPYRAYSLLNNYYGRPFNSPADVCVHRADGSVWFTDPDYGFFQKFRIKRVLPNAVWVWEPARGRLRAVEDSLIKPSAITFSRDGSTCFISDTAAYQGRPNLMIRGAQATIYRYDVVQLSHGGLGLANRTLFAYIPRGAPSRLALDAKNNVMAATAAGLQLFDPSGNPICCISVPGGTSSFVAVDESRVLLLSGHNIFEANLSHSWVQ